jgi:hypothetical protein
MTTPYVAALRRKYDATQEPAKRAELAHALMLVGVDVNAVETVSEPSRAKSKPPVGRTTKPLVTAEPTEPVDKAAVTSGFLSGKAAVNEPAVKTPTPRRRGPGRPRIVKADDK